MELLLLYIAIFINCITVILNNWLYFCTCVYSNNFVCFFLEQIGNCIRSWPDQFLVGRAASAISIIMAV